MFELEVLWFWGPPFQIFWIDADRDCLTAPDHDAIRQRFLCCGVRWVLMKLHPILDFEIMDAVFPNWVNIHFVVNHLKWARLPHSLSHPSFVCFMVMEWPGEETAQPLEIQSHQPRKGPEKWVLCANSTDETKAQGAWCAQYIFSRNSCTCSWPTSDAQKTIYPQDTGVGAKPLLFKRTKSTFPWCRLMKQSSFGTWKESTSGNICQVCLINLLLTWATFIQTEPSDEHASMEESRNGAVIHQKLCQIKSGDKTLKAFARVPKVYDWGDCGHDVNHMSWLFHI